MPEMNLDVPNSAPTPADTNPIIAANLAAVDSHFQDARRG